MRLPLLFIVISVIMLIGCATDQEKLRAQYQTNLCDFKRSQPHIFISHVDNHGEVVEGDFVYKVDAQHKGIASVLAVPVDNVLRAPREGWGICCQWALGYVPNYYCGAQYCRENVGHSLMGVAGLARAPDREQAENLALKNCKAAIRQFADTVGSNPSQLALRCKIQKFEWCD